ncbi:hypothetical protein U5817_00050 [Aromatoleum evansii]|uniref:Sel1 repeat family protein n=1 Tax=Aromatoleum evansii TaxID=59406 RepID=A0ABZ1AQR8_AROEV|nr:hypothetical protein U5817_00050 [Aromatoleum evansii]
MTIKELAFSAQQRLQASVGIPVKRGHVYELLAASFGFKSYAAFSAVALLSDSGLGTSVPTLRPEVIGRSVQLGYLQNEGEAIATELVSYAAGRALSYVEWRDIRAALAPSTPVEEDEDDDDIDDWEDEIDSDDGAEERSEHSGLLQLSSLHASTLLIDGLERAAAGNDALAHFALAAVNRCELPSSYLYEESLKGRKLTATEQRWADEYIQNKPRFEKYVHHLRHAATTGVRAAALEFAEVFRDPQFFAVAEASQGAVDARRMVKVAARLGDRDAEHRWLRVAAEEGSSRALEELADFGDAWALRTLAESGDVDAIRELAERARKTDLREAWMWQYVAKRMGTDLTRSSLRAYHDGGLYDGQDYDDDQGGPLYVAGDEGLQLTPLSPPEDRAARKMAHEFFSAMRNGRR